MSRSKRKEALNQYRQLLRRMVEWERHPRWSSAISFMPGTRESYEETKRTAYIIVAWLEEGKPASDGALNRFLDDVKLFQEAVETLLSQSKIIENEECPRAMRLYKYVTAERMDVLTNGHIRFTQHQDLNDPFDLSPFVEAIIGEGEMPRFVRGLEQLAEERARHENAVANATDLLEKMLLSNEKVQGRAVPTDEERARIRISVEQIFLNNPEQATAFNELYGIVARGVIPIAASMLPEVEKNVAQQIPQMLNELVGILSLTERPDNPMMWAHYAGGHTGFVLEFDSANSFFYYPSKKGESALKPVRYGERRVIKSLVADASNVEDLFFVKTPEWSYEEEWRLVQSLEDADLVVGARIHLFAFPPDCITGVILGMKMEEHRRRALIEFLQTDSRYTHVDIYQATLDAKTGCIFSDPLV